MLCNSCEWYESGNVEKGQCGNRDSAYYGEDVDGSQACGKAE